VPGDGGRQAGTVLVLKERPGRLVSREVPPRRAAGRRGHRLQRFAPRPSGPPLPPCLSKRKVVRSAAGPVVRWPGQEVSLMGEDTVPRVSPLECVGLVLLTLAPAVFLAVLAWASTGRDLGGVLLLGSVGFL